MLHYIVLFCFNGITHVFMLQLLCVVQLYQVWLSEPVMSSKTKPATQRLMPISRDQDRNPPDDDQNFSLRGQSGLET